MTAGKKSKAKVPLLEERFAFRGDAVAPGSPTLLRPTLFEVDDRLSGASRVLKLWRKTSTEADRDLRGLWRHEMRQVQRVMSYGGARDVIVNILEFVEDEEFFGVVLEQAGQPLTVKRRRANRNHWLQNLATARARTLLWKNARRIAKALGIIHSQGLVHGRLSPEVIMTEGLEEPDFQLSGFEWSLWVGADSTEKSHAKLSSSGAPHQSGIYSFAGDWQALGHIVAECLGTKVNPNGEIAPAGSTMLLNASEQSLLKRMIAPSRFDAVEAQAISRSIDEILSSIAQSVSVQSGTFILGFIASARLGDAVYSLTEGEIPVDEFRKQLDWIRADLDSGAKLLVPRSFDPARDSLRLVTDAMLYRFRALPHEGAPFGMSAFASI